MDRYHDYCRVTTGATKPIASLTARNSTIVEPETITKDEERVTQYCYQHRDATVMDAVKIVLGLDK